MNVKNGERSEVRAMRYGNIGFIIFDAPGANLLTRLGFEQISAILDEYKADTTIHAVVFAGTHGKHFCGGVRLKWMRELQMSSEMGNETIDYCYQVGLQIVQFPKPTIAAIEDGDCAGVGAEIIACCLFVVASEKNFSTIKFAALSARLGFMLGLGITWRLAHKIRIDRAARFLIKKDTTSLMEAYEMGIVDELLPGEDFTEEVREFAQSVIHGRSPERYFLCMCPTYARLSAREIRSLALGCPAKTVELILLTLELAVQAETFEEAAGFECEMFKELFFSEEAIEGIGAVLKKREPNFSKVIV